MGEPLLVYSKRPLDASQLHLPIGVDPHCLQFDLTAAKRARFLILDLLPPGFFTCSCHSSSHWTHGTRVSLNAGAVERSLASIRGGVSSPRNSDSVSLIAIFGIGGQLERRHARPGR